MNMHERGAILFAAVIGTSGAALAGQTAPGAAPGPQNQPQSQMMQGQKMDTQMGAMMSPQMMKMMERCNGMMDRMEQMNSSANPRT